MQNEETIKSLSRIEGFRQSIVEDVLSEVISSCQDKGVSVAEMLVVTLTLHDMVLETMKGGN